MHCICLFNRLSLSKATNMILSSLHHIWFLRVVSLQYFPTSTNVEQFPRISVQIKWVLSVTWAWSNYEMRNYVNALFCHIYRNIILISWSYLRKSEYGNGFGLKGIVTKYLKTFPDFIFIYFVVVIIMQFRKYACTIYLYDFTINSMWCHTNKILKLD